MFQPEIWWIINEKMDELNGGLICAIVLGGKCGKWEEANSWTVQIPDGKPEVIKPVLPEVKRWVQSMEIVVNT